MMQIELDIYKKRIRITALIYSFNSQGIPKGRLNYYWLKYPNRFWRWYFTDTIIRKIREFSASGIALTKVRNFTIIDGPPSLGQRTIFDFNTRKE